MKNGALFENYIAQELSSHEIVPYYFKSRAIGEIDFLIEDNNEIIPLEIKSGKDFKTHKALDNLMASKEYSINKSFVLSLSNIEVDDNCAYIPIYMTGLFGCRNTEDIFINLDIFN